MSKAREIVDYLDDIRNAVADVHEFTRDMDYEAFSSEHAAGWLTME